MTVKIQIAKTITPYTGTGGFYCSRHLVPASEQRLNEWVRSLRLGFEDPRADAPKMTNIGEYHMTVQYSPGTIPDNLIPHTHLVSTHAVGAALFSPRKDTLVLLLHSTPELQARFKYWVSSGCKPTYADYQPHITLSDNLGSVNYEELRARVDAALKRNPLILTFGPEEIEDINPFSSK